MPKLINTKLYFDNDPDRSFVEKLRKAVVDYTTKRFPGQSAPNVCLVPIQKRWWTPGIVEGIEIRASHGLLANHFELGVEIKTEEAYDGAA